MTITALVVVAVFGAILLMIDPHRIEHVYFRYRSGVVAFDVGRVGREAAGFDAFVIACEARAKGALRE
jgi:hypothetical protein